MAATIIASRCDITEISETFRTDRVITLPDIRTLVVPVPPTLTCEAYFESPMVSTGSRLLVSVNGADVIDLYYDNEHGKKQEAVDLAGHLAPGENELRVRCLVSCHPIDNLSDAGLLWLRGPEATIIRKRFATKGSLEPFDLRWTLLLEPTER
jgi:hypothetical protein